MKQAVVLLGLLTAAAAAGQTLTPSTFEMRVGESASALAEVPPVWRLRWAPIPTVYFAEPAIVAISNNSILYPNRTATVAMQAIAPGTATLFARVNDAFNVRVGTVDVYACGGVQIDAPRTTFTARAKEVVSIETRAAGDGTMHWEWFLGRTGDARVSLGTGPTLRFTAQSNGTHFVWVRVSDYCTIATKEFRIDVVSSPARRRAVQ